MLDLSGGNEILISGLWMIAKGFVFYLALPILVCALIVGKVLRLNGKQYTSIMKLVVAACALFFILKGIPFISDQLDTLNR